jgi:hypothetical protein
MSCNFTQLRSITYKFFDVMPYIQVDICLHFRGTYCPLLQVKKQAQKEPTGGRRRKVPALRSCIFKREVKGREKSGASDNKSYRWTWRVTCSMHGRGEIHTQFL